MSDSEKLLTAEEQAACQQIAASDTGLASQRAAVLLAIDGGATRAQASKQTGLTVGQVGYLLRVFRQKRLGLFPDTGPGKAQPAPEAAASEPEKGKGEKKAKKDKKPKKDKKGKKAKAKKKEPKKDKKSKAKKAKDKAAKKKPRKK